MTIIKKQNDYRVEFNGSETFYIIDSTENTLGYFPTQRKALNAFNRILKQAGV